MAKAIEIVRDEKHPSIPTSQSQTERQALVDRYAKQNPVKYATKKEALAKWVLKG